MSENPEQKSFLQFVGQKLISFLLRNWFPLVIVLLYFIFLKKEIPFFHDLLNIHSLQANNYFSVIIDATASVFGIVLAVVLLTFELSKHTLFKRVGGNILNNPVVRNFVFIGVITLVLSVVSYILVQDFANGRKITIAYYIGYLFIFFIVTIYPAMKSILYSTSGIKKALQLISQLKVKDFDATDFDSNSISLLEDDETPLFMIKAELISSVRENDFEAYNLILKALNWKAIELMDDGHNRKLLEKVQKGLALIWKAGNFEAVRVGSYQYFDGVWESILTIYVNAIDKKHNYLHYQEIGFFFIHDFVSILGRNKLHDNLSTGAKTLSNIFRFSLEANCPEQIKLDDLYGYFDREGGGHNTEASLHWDDIVDFLRSLSDIQKIAIENSDRTLYENCEQEVRILLSRIWTGEFPNLGELQVAYLIIEIVQLQVYNAERALLSNLFDRLSNPFKLEKYMLETAIKEGKIYTEHVMTLIGDFIIKCQRQGTLNSIGLLHDWGTMSRLISKHFKNTPMTQKATDYIIKTLEVMKSEIENTQLSNESKNYEEIRVIMKSLKEALIRDNGDSSIQQTNRLDEVLGTFKEVKRDKEYRIVSW